MVDEIKIPFDGNARCQCGADFSKYGARCTCERKVTTDEIKPKYVDGEPVCCEDCRKYWRNFNTTERPDGCAQIRYGDPCIPALRRDRDRYKARCADLENLIKTMVDVPENDWEAIKKSYRKKAALVFRGNAGKDQSDE